MLHQAALGVGTESQGNLRNVVNCRVEDGPAFVLGSLRAGACEDLSLDLVFEAGKKVTFFASGPGDVHLTGYYVTHFVEGDNGTQDAADEDNEMVSDDDDDDGVHVETRREPSRKRVKYNDPLDLGEIIEGSSSSDEDEEPAKRRNEGDDNDDDEEADPDHPMKPKSLLAALVDEEPLDDDDESVDGNFVLGDTADEDAADAADLRAMEEECHTKLKLPAGAQTATNADESSTTTASTEDSPKKVHFSPEPEVRAESEGESSVERSVDAEEARKEEDEEEHQRKAAMLDARQATPYARKESLTQRNKDVVRGLKRFTTEKEKELESLTADDKQQKKKQEQKKSEKKQKQKQQEQKPGQSGKETPVAVRDTKEGLHIEELVVGTGGTPKPGRPIFVRYRGMLDSGKVFDRSGKKPFRFVFGAGQVIRGWDLGLADMRVGGKRRLRIPPALAYGKEASGPIPANSTLTFEVELVKTM